ncbi:hypothetical protein BC628DRAFT_1409987 [Trametes gibbosa]|nr:hypothetical protein BC628DRAFT_1409987 [Trametes gibbosa]
MGLPIPRDDAAAIEQVRSMLSIKQQQKELIEQRRGSTAGIAPVGSPAILVSTANGTSKLHVPTRPGGRSPITTGPRRSIVALSANTPPNRAVSPLARQPSPPPSHHAQHGLSQPMLHPPPPPLSIQDQHMAPMHQHALPAAPVSFARRRATRQLGGAKGKPADIMISPRDATADHLQPSIQSAPPIPRAGPAQGMTGRFSSMALPSLPPVLGPGQSTQRMTASRVPPTPTRLSMARNPPAGGPSVLTPTVASISTTAAAAAASAVANARRSPPTASVPIASTLVPPTPAALHTPGNAGGPPGSAKAAFLAPFETFYDALADARTLKHWLAGQLQKSQALAAQLQHQTEHVEALVSAAVERRMGPVHDEVYALQRRVEELEAALGHATGTAASGLVRTPSGSAHAHAHGHGHGHGHAHGHAHAHAHAHTHGQTYSPNMGTAALGPKGKAKANGVPESYQFPPSADAARRPESARRALSPERESRSFPGSQTGSPVPFDVGRRLSVSAIRLDPRAGAPVASDASPHRASASGVSRERERERERESGLGGRALPPPPSAAPASAGGAGSGGWGRPWSPRGTRVSLPAGTSATRSSLVDRPALARRASAQRVQGEGFAYPAHEGAEERGRDRERDRERERDRDREKEASSPPPPPPLLRRDVRSPDSMEE